MIPVPLTGPNFILPSMCCLGEMSSLWISIPEAGWEACGREFFVGCRAPDPAPRRVVLRACFLLFGSCLMCIYKRPEVWALLSWLQDFRTSMERVDTRARGYQKPQSKHLEMNQAAQPREVPTWHPLGGSWATTLLSHNIVIAAEHRLLPSISHNLPWS